jgi:E3 ubiquitin ligase
MSMLVLGIILLGVGALVVVAGLVVRAKGKRILAAPLHKTGDGGKFSGPASFEGQVRAHQPLAAPCSNQPCVYFNLKVEKKVKATRVGSSGVQQSVSWKTISDTHQGSVFQLDDGSGPVTVDGQQQMDAELTQVYSGQPPAHLAINAAPAGNEQILEIRATERIIGIDGKLFALGELQQGYLGKPATKKMIASTRGRDALVGKTRKIALAVTLFGSLVAAAGVPVIILKPGEAPACGDVKDVQSECYVTTSPVEKEDGINHKKYKVQEHIVHWTVTKSGKYQLESRQDPRSSARSNPVLQVENGIGMPMNIGFNIGIGAGNSSTSTKTKTATLIPGEYKIYVWGDEKGAEKFLIKISELDAAANVSSK